MGERLNLTDEDYLQMPTSVDIDATLLNPNETQVRMEGEEDIMEDGVPNKEYHPRSTTRQ